MGQIKTLSLENFIQNNTVQSNTDSSRYDMSNILSVVNRGQKSYFNLSKTINLNNLDDMPQSYYNIYVAVYGDTWTNISFKFFKTIKLWWLLCKFNRITNPCQPITIGERIRIPTDTFISLFLQSLK